MDPFVGDLVQTHPNLITIAALATVSACGFAVAWIRGRSVIRRLEAELPECDLTILIAEDVGEMREGILAIQALLERQGGRGQTIE